MTGFEVVDVRYDDPRLDALFHDVLHASFTPDELVDLDALRSGMQDGELYVTAIDGPDGWAGVAVVEGTPNEDVHLLSYLAARPGGRSRGVGTALLDDLVERWSRADGPALVLAEVHDPGHWPTSSDERPVARLRFYARHGARRLPFMWVQPRVAPDRERVAGMYLLVLHVRPPALVPGDAVDSGMVVGWVSAQREGAEGPGAAADPELVAVRTAAASQDPLPLLPI